MFSTTLALASEPLQLIMGLRSDLSNIKGLWNTVDSTLHCLLMYHMALVLMYSVLVSNGIVFKGVLFTQMEPCPGQPLRHPPCPVPIWEFSIWYSVSLWDLCTQYNRFSIMYSVFYCRYMGLSIIFLMYSPEYSVLSISCPRFELRIRGSMIHSLYYTKYITLSTIHSVYPMITCICIESLHQNPASITFSILAE